jgi:dihydrofolate reductase
MNPPLYLCAVVDRRLEAVRWLRTRLWATIAPRRGLMRRLRVFESISVDGFFCDAQGDMGFAHAGAPDPEFGAWVASNASQGGALLFGRKTYQMMEQFWSSPMAAEQMPQVAEGMRAATKYVVSTELVPTWHNSQRLDDELISGIRALKAGSGPDITILGSGSLVAQLGAVGLIDEYQFVIVPVAIGAGRTLFTRPQALRLVSERAFENGNVVLTYAAV